jgi:phosphatidate cytidylyltransferase|tara:strand:- start:809 stop:1597 length:789 start_codon:yes stop_codon:yes gene_type:complete
MLRNRVYTALALASAAAITIFWAPVWLFALIFGVACCFAAYEWAALAGWQTPRERLLYVFSLVALMLLSLTQQTLWLEIVTLSCLVWLGGFVSIIVHPRTSAMYRSRWFVASLGWILLLCAWFSLLTLVQGDNGRLWVFWLFLLTTATDVGAFFLGRAFGQHALAPQISPGKTREGAGGGLVLALVVCVPLLFLSGALDFYASIGLTIVMSIVSIFGDLFESLLKRVSGIKDSGALLPGHGGLLDRIDSIIAVVPFLAWSVA